MDRADSLGLDVGAASTGRADLSLHLVMSRQREGRAADPRRLLSWPVGLAGNGSEVCVPVSAAAVAGMANGFK